MGLFDQRQRSNELPERAPRYGILLVDDEILNLTSLASLLEDDYHVHIASNANDALQMLADPAFASGIHLIVSDQRMPGMTGVELLAHTRQLKPDAKRLLLTGYTDIDAIVGAINEAAVFPPFSTATRSRGQATSANFCLGVMPPRAMFGRS